MKKNSNKHIKHVQRTLVLAVCAAFGQAYAGDEEVAQMTRPESSVGVGVGVASGDVRERAIFGQYSGMRGQNANLLFDVDYSKRDEATGTWTQLLGRNLGNENRELSFGQQKQGDWRYALDYSELVRNYTNTLNSTMQGVGTNNISITRVTQGNGNDINLKTERKSLGLSAEKWLTSNLLFEVSFKEEKKEGARMFARGVNCSAASVPACGATTGALLVLPEPIDSSTKQIEAKLNFSGEGFAINGGYYGRLFTNKYGALNQTITGNLFNPNMTNLLPATVNPWLGGALALPPDNQSHKFYLNGSVTFSPTTKGNFKFAHTRSTQNESFGSMGFATAPRGALDAVVDTTLLQAGLTSRPMQKLTVTANLRYEQRSDKTPLAVYSPDGVSTNSWGSRTKISGKLDATYQLPEGYRATAGIEYDMRDMGRPAGTSDTSGQATALRAKNDEIGVRFELRKAMSETLTGSASVAHSHRNGSRWMTVNAGNATMADGQLQGTGFGLFPLLWMDANRDKLKLAANWDPTEKLALQFMAESSADRYYAPTKRGARDGVTHLFSVDASYAVSDTFKLTGWYSRNDTIFNINGPNNSYMESLRQLNNSVGLGVRGNPSSKFEWGGDLTFSYETNRYAQGVHGVSTQPNALPAVAYRQQSVNVFGKYSVDKTSDVRVNLLHQRYYTNEWYWSNGGVPFFYSDGTTLVQQQQQNVTFIGASYVYKWQ